MRNLSNPPELDRLPAGGNTARCEIDEDIGYEAALPYLMVDAMGEADQPSPWSSARGVMS